MAAQRGSAKAEKKRLESLRNKIDRMFTVLTLRVEGQTQDEIALTLDISRNQVKYIVELVRESYERFTAACTPASARPSQAGGISHVQQ